MSGGFSADPDGLRAAAGGFDLVGDEAHRLAQTLSSALSAEHQSWGADEAGSAFAEKYLPHVDAVDTTIDDLRTLLQSIRANVVAIADGLQQTDDSVGHVFGTIDPDGDGSGTGTHRWPTDPGRHDAGRGRSGGPVGGGYTGNQPRARTLPGSSDWSPGRVLDGPLGGIDAAGTDAAGSDAAGNHAAGSDAAGDSLYKPRNQSWSDLGSSTEPGIHYAAGGSRPTSYETQQGGF